MGHVWECREVSMFRFCTKCGTRLFETSKSCHTCGHDPTDLFGNHRRHANKSTESEEVPKNPGEWLLYQLLHRFLIPKVVSITLILLVGFAIFGKEDGCNSNIPSTEDGNKMYSNDRKCSIVVPKDWRHFDSPRDDTNLYVVNPSATAFFVQLTHLKVKRERHSPVSLKEFSKEAIGKFANEKEVQVLSCPHEVIIGGMNGIQHILLQKSGNFSDDLVIFYTILEDNSHFYRVFAWTSSSNLNNNRDVLLGITQSFKVRAENPVKNPK
jgi:hypothetical protein